MKEVNGNRETLRKNTTSHSGTTLKGNEKERDQMQGTGSTRTDIRSADERREERETQPQRGKEEREDRDMNEKQRREEREKVEKDRTNPRNGSL